ncbi:hypothetical protein PF005_g28268 [Phytophthora fragariae]|uniref:Uncharacterized protein n=1 Tax=Phytophthora fragariae TaxID=53985 RepID=A0A6A3Q1D0_9STRA|nr:hypothetical protein PF003_g15103 [Phytophthora fragariae]KAE8917261.1 hypothetical protein PF009_g32417 [Phytophthora fragariae]KAE8974112.1 hypothetical protein PF011_g24989 [Phytophthora fragariae]KAE9057639.1 hypothetical protein PF006_g32368 [Phytophthora fragariae]KAE9066589.1 hypothetical protein PF007_g28390 [Phytophthora fragariae]
MWRCADVLAAVAAAQANCFTKCGVRVTVCGVRGLSAKIMGCAVRPENRTSW